MTSTSDHQHSQKHSAFTASLASEHRGSVSDIMRSIEVEEEKEKHVLVVDDDNISRNVLSKMLERLNFKVTTVEGGKQALILLGQDSTFQLLLVDVLMPEMDGIELLRIFKKAYSKDIPIIMVSSSEDPDTIAECFRSGAEDFLQKPIRFEMLKRRVEMCLDDRLRRRKETMYQEMLRKERENRNRLSKQVEEQEKELQQIKSQISDTIETPMQVVMKTIGDLMDGSYSVEAYKGALVAILKSLGSRDLYKPAFNMLLEKGNVDDTTRLWLQTEFMNEADLGKPLRDPSNPQENTRSSQPRVHFDERLLTKEIPRDESTSKTSISNLNSFSFDVFAQSPDIFIENIPFMYQSLGLIDEFNIDARKIVNFMRRLHAYYHSNPYHNFMHALDVTQFVYSSLCNERISLLFTPLDKLCLMIAASCHDVDHPGLNNNYQINAKTALALIYNDISVLENHHCCIAFRLLREKECNITENLDGEDYKEFRKTTITAILATDMAHHFEILTKFQTRIQTGPLSKESKDDKQQFMNIILKCADVSNVVRPFPVAKRWAGMLIDEFLSQGDKEKELGLIVSPLMDRESLDKAQMQVNFIDYIAGPLFKAFVQYVPSLNILSSTIQSNRTYWSALLEKQQEIGENVNSPETRSPLTPNKDDEFVLALSDESETEIIAKVKGFNVLVIEGNPQSEQSLISLLKRTGYEIVSSSNIHEALLLLKEEEAPKFDVALLDFSTKGMDPAQFIRELRQYEDNKKHYTAILGLANPSLLEQYANAENVDTVIAKPASGKELLKSIEKCIEISLNYAESVDFKLALEQSGGDADFLQELLLELVEQGKQQAKDMKAYIEKLDWYNLNLQAHSLKGASAQLACKPLSQSAFILERAAKVQEEENLTSSLQVLEKRLDELAVYLNNNL